MRRRHHTPLAWSTALLVALIATSASAHVFSPEQSAGLDVFLDQGPALLLIDGEPCMAEMLFESFNPAVATVGTNSTNKATFGLKVFGKHAGLTQIAVTVNNGKTKQGDPCGEGGTVYVFDVRVWPSKKDYEKKLKGVIKETLELLSTANKERLEVLADEAKAALDKYKLSQLAGLPQPRPSNVATFSIESMFATTVAWNELHADLSEALEAAALAGQQALVDCGFTEGFVLDAGFLPEGAQIGGGSAVDAYTDQAIAFTEMSVAKLQKATKKTLAGVKKLGADGGVPVDVTMQMPTNLRPLVEIPSIGIDAKGPPPPGILISLPPPPPVLGVVFSVDVAGLQPSLHVSGRAEPGASLSVTVTGGAGQLAQDPVVVVDESGNFATSFTEGIPRGTPVTVTVEDNDVGSRDALLIHIAHHADN